MFIIEKFQTNKNKDNLLKTPQKGNKQTNTAYIWRITPGFLTTIPEIIKQ